MYKIGEEDGDEDFWGFGMKIGDLEKNMKMKMKTELRMVVVGEEDGDDQMKMEMIR